MKKGIILILIMIVGLSSLFSGCIQSGTGTLILKITDAPPELNITKALVSISTIQVHLGTGGNNSTAGWYTVVDEQQTFDLIELQNVTDDLGIKNLSAGLYTQIRLTVESALVTIDGIEHDLNIPSNKVKLITPFEIVANETTILTLDFDVHESVHETGNNKYIMNPTIKVIQE